MTLIGFQPPLMPARTSAMRNPLSSGAPCARSDTNRTRFASPGFIRPRVTPQTAPAIRTATCMPTPSLRHPAAHRLAASKDFLPEGVNTHCTNLLPEHQRFIQQATTLGQSAQIWRSAHPQVVERGPTSIKTPKQAALLLIALSQAAAHNSSTGLSGRAPLPTRATQDDPTAGQTVSERARQLLVQSNALAQLPDPILYRVAKIKGTPLAKDALELRNEKLMPIYEKWLKADPELNDPLRTAILAVAAAYPLHSAPSGFESDKLAILCSFAGGVYPKIQPEIQAQAANYVSLNLKKVPFFALWALVLNLSDRERPPSLEIGPELDDDTPLEHILEGGQIPDDIALPWERPGSALRGDHLGHLAAKELCARLLVERERLPRETAFLFLGQRANVLTAFVIATTVLPVVFPKLTPKQRLGLVGALAFAAAVHVIMVPTLNKISKSLGEHKHLARMKEGINQLKERLKIKQKHAAEHTREKLFLDPPKTDDANSDASNT